MDCSSQSPLSLKYETKKSWADFRQKLGVSQTGAAIVMDICSTSGWISYSRTARHYDKPTRYRNPLYTWRKVVSQVDRMEEMGLIHHDRCDPGQRGWQSAIRPTGKLRSIHDEIVGGKRLTLAKPAEVVLLRDDKGHLIDYRDTRDLERMRRKIERINEAISSADIDPTIVAPIARIYNKGFDRGGRFYAMGKSWQNMKAEARRSLMIGGEPVVELDYNTLHPAILYAEAGANMPTDCYDIPGWPRKLVKLAMLTLINAPTKQKARLSLAHSDLMAERSERGSQVSLRLASQLIEGIKRLHKPIAHAFHSDAGARLMSIDATMAEMVMNVMLLQGVVVLPVHDSFLIQSSKANKLEEAMMQAAHRAGYYALKVSQK